ncbi:glycosyltransferase family 2 protein [Aquabacterium sp.]|uniref:glycosyltransferase family 2 protein n=1 Tax=Aquabacterium sp. TaxID=1872578 RepID=UPI00248931C2|nr:glycosyltransferase family 2 protein [Aquabacterium sp.]MDI1259434.1 glycosyltransferase family 2 protein [Aquabacterium sp.]
MKLINKPRDAIRDALQNMKQGIRAANRNRLHRRRMKKGVDYATWIARHDTPTAQDRAAWQVWLEAHTNAPTISLILNVEANSDAELLKRSIASVRSQAYPHWQLILVSPEQGRAPIPSSTAEDLRIQSQPTHDDALAQVKGTWTALLQVGDQLREHSLLLMAQAMQSHPGAKIIYTDDDQIDGNGQRSGHHFKPEWSYDFQLSANYIGSACLISTSHLIAAVGHRHQGGAVYTFDALLRCIEGLPATDIIHVPHVLWHHPATVRHSLDAPYVQALQEHLDRVSPGARASTTSQGFLKVGYPVPALPPLVSIVICTRNQYKLLHTCIQSITQKTTYPQYEVIIVDNGSDEARTLTYLQQLPNKDARVRVIRDDSPFNYSALNNMAVEHAQGEVVALVNNDIEVINGNWLTEMIGHALRPEVGCVGAKLLYPDDTIQHAGVLVGGGIQAPNTIAAHYLRGIPREAPGYANRAIVTQQLTAVTAACLVVRKSTFLDVGGLDSANLSVAYNDVDFCLRVGELGLHNIWTPHAILYHHESISRGRDTSSKNIARFLPEAAYMRQRWTSRMRCDPFYNPNLNHQRPDFLLACTTDAHDLVGSDES